MCAERGLRCSVVAAASSAASSAATSPRRKDAALRLVVFARGQPRRAERARSPQKLHTRRRQNALQPIRVHSAVLRVMLEQAAEELHRAGRVFSPAGAPRPRVNSARIFAPSCRISQHLRVARVRRVKNRRREPRDRELVRCARPVDEVAQPVERELPQNASRHRRGRPDRCRSCSARSAAPASPRGNRCPGRRGAAPSRPLFPGAPGSAHGTAAPVPAITTIPSRSVKAARQRRIAIAAERPAAPPASAPRPARCSRARSASVAQPARYTPTCVGVAGQHRKERRELRIRRQLHVRGGSMPLCRTTQAPPAVGRARTHSVFVPPPSIPRTRLAPANPAYGLPPSGSSLWLCIVRTVSFRWPPGWVFWGGPASSSIYRP